MSAEDTDTCLVAKRPCGCYCIAASKRVIDADCMEDFNAAVLSGCSLEWVTAANVRSNPWGCRACDEKEPSLF